ncbi:hypothetical protein BH10ACI2_BH10ACI2_23400 [soil metagenome]
MRKATYEILEGDESFYAEIPGFQGVWANAPTLEACRVELAEVLEEWILFGASYNMPLPKINGIKVNIKPSSFCFVPTE